MAFKYFTQEDINKFVNKKDELYSMSLDELVAFAEKADTLYKYNDQPKILKRIAELLKEIDGEETERVEALKHMMVSSILRDNAITWSYTKGRITMGIIGSVHQSDGHLKASFRYFVDGNPKRWLNSDMYINFVEAEEVLDSLSKIYENQCHSVDITFPSGELVFGNYFYTEDHKYDELPDDIQYKDMYCINNTTGIQNSMEWLAENKGLLYGQLGNMSYAVYQISEDEIILSTPYMDCYYDEETDEEKDYPKDIGVKPLGDVCCSVWRFETADKQTLKEHDFDLDKCKKTNKYSDFVEAKVTPGEWNCEVYYRHMSDKEMVEKWGYPVYARLTRKK